MTIGLNGVPVARLGLILGEDGATGSGKPFKHLQAPFPPMCVSVAAHINGVVIVWTHDRARAAS